jgi:hypothetical protein
MKRAGTSEKYQNNNLKALIAYSKFLGPSISFYEIENKNQVISFLDTKIKNSEEDPDKRWITTWNDYLVRIKYFFRWMYNCKDKDLDDVPFSDWETPDFVKIKNKKTKRISPYLENELWEKDDLLTIIKYESYKRNKAILALLWDLDARPHELTLLKIKHIRLKEKYGEGEIPHEAKTGTGPILLTTSVKAVNTPGTGLTEIINVEEKYPKTQKSLKEESNETRISSNKYHKVNSFLSLNENHFKEGYSNTPLSNAFTVLTPSQSGNSSIIANQGEFNNPLISESDLTTGTYDPKIINSICRFEGTDRWFCRNCNMKGDKWFMMKHPCNNNNNKNNINQK